jgi:hypothetical protein
MWALSVSIFVSLATIRDYAILLKIERRSDRSLQIDEMIAQLNCREPHHGRDQQEIAKEQEAI